MKKTKVIFSVLTALFLSISMSHAQAVPVSLSERVAHTDYIVIGELIEQHGFWDAAHQRLNTLNTFAVRANLKGNARNTKISVVTEGGMLDLFAVHVCPSDELKEGREYMLFLKEESPKWQDSEFKIKYPNIVQTKSPYVFSVLPYENGQYVDVFGRFKYSENQLLTRLKNDFQLDARTPSGDLYEPRPDKQIVQTALQTITTVTDGTGSVPASGFVAGTIVAANDIIINGSGFGAATGTLEFRNADDGGATAITLSNASDLISWTDVLIRAKIPRNAGTGNVEVKTTGGISAGTAAITIAWAELCFNQAARDALCTQTGAPLRHRTDLGNVNGTGGYTFRYNDGTGAAANFSTDAPAKAAFSRAVSTWRCANLINFSLGTTTSTIYDVMDGISTVLYDNALPLNVLAICATGYSGSCVSSCANGIRWAHSNMDIRILTVPKTGFTWNYTTALPTSGQLDFETVMLHELGHGVGLGHVIDNAKTMNFSISNGVAIRALSTTEISSGNFRMGHSTAAQCTGSPMTAITVSGCTIVPVEILSFQAVSNKKEVQLKWLTATEINNDHFDVEQYKVRAATTKATFSTTQHPRKASIITASSKWIETAKKPCRKRCRF
jgi:hypothetical protein